ncbi:hypothetical protein BBJ28_00011793 [Nothophytophthora sp. Chile5]|nr:hypothetical protein BBJ28_00011793 [Nothophytophthora sp. Chile5]
MADDKKPLAALLSLAVSKAAVPGSFREKSYGYHATEEEHQTQTMMYAARMTYLDDSEQNTPDSLFLTRKQAQKMVQRQDSVKLPLKKLETRKVNATNTGGGSTGVGWKKGKAAAPSPEKRLTWEPKFQAGCHFWQCVETGECRVLSSHVSATMQSVDDQEDGNEDEEDPPFPDSFAFLKDPSKKTH